MIVADCLCFPYEYMPMYDIVYPLKKQEHNLDLLYSLRSLDKFGGEYGRVWIVGHCPTWVTNVEHLPVEQSLDKWRNVRALWMAVCAQKELSADFILMNDDFILTKPVEDWAELSNCYVSTLAEKAEYYKHCGVELSPWRKGFEFNDELLKSMGVDNPLSYEYHGPMLMNKTHRKGLFKRKALLPYADKSEPLLFTRSIYGNLYPRDNPKKIRDIKFVADAFNPRELTENAFFSVTDDIIGNEARCPHLNGYLRKTFPDKSKFEI